MLLFNTSLLLHDPTAFVVLMTSISLALLVGISFHEFSHAAAANVQGDLTATNMGRLTLNPRAHLDRAGTILMLLVGFGWGKPVPVNPRNLRSGRVGIAIVSAAGPMANVVVALAFAALFHLGVFDARYVGGPLYGFVNLRSVLATIGYFGIVINLMLAVFNLLPVPPLDGGGILAGIAPRQAFPVVQQVQRIGPIILVLLIASTYVTNWNLLGTIFSPVYHLADILVGH